MEEAIVQADRSSTRITDVWAFRLEDNKEYDTKYLLESAKSLIIIRAYPVIKQTPKTFTYVDIYPTFWNRTPDQYGEPIECRQLISSSKAKVFLDKDGLMNDYVRRKFAQHQIHERIAKNALSRLEYAQFKGKILIPYYKPSDWTDL
jgi:hypothetical protein